ncbi:2-succinyl-6-hydroxy-2,4-cyclohexadiene-1-carboxylate synthase [Vibrio tapetis]|uniref:Putative 2-succinyl-6-hydroxy-2,4-cyclohexadiene-1-carboxylate synthase n=1 Tax=Vibrio tapetis subsp. tapetis TaxID=1671868 RepID=A0A2N8ZDJ6_9VIBR|nr:2-succinyl-6-hydroxy-2,4-cyclohexadiene-1-carboxylate synthase [Vibrio tapetis]SON49963.1 putative thioesterase, menaquinone synthesis [Vibrio tapetis subsp. tapetis]
MLSQKLNTHWLTADLDSSKPVIIFLHGLLGASDDWLSITPYLQDYSCLAIDLPFHGQSQSISCSDFDYVCELVVKAAQNVISKGRKVTIVGYSLGARITMYGLAYGGFASLNISNVVLEGGNFGLREVAEKRQRWISDERWAERFSSEPIEQVLDAWYQQAVFSSLNDEQRQTLLAKRKHNKGLAIASMLMATSLAKQPYLLNRLQELTSPRLHYICGERDAKFTHLARSSELIFSLVEQAGHNVHQEQPEAFAQIIRKVTA